MIFFAHLYILNKCILLFYEKSRLLKINKIKKLIGDKNSKKRLR